MNDGDSIVGEVASGIAGEFSKLGKTVTSQLAGSKPKDPQAASPQKEIGGFAKTITGQLFGSKPEPSPKAQNIPQPFSFLDELKNMGRSVSAQVAGAEDLSSKQIAAMAKKDDEFSEKEAQTLRTRIAQIYQEYQAKKKNEEQEKQQQQLAVQEQKKKQGEFEKQKRQISVNPMVERAKAEIKNYGAE